MALREHGYDPDAAIRALAARDDRQRQAWTNSEDRAFRVGMQRRGKDLCAVQQEFVRTKDLGAVIRYYYLTHGEAKRQKREKLAEIEAHALSKSGGDTSRPNTPVPASTKLEPIKEV